MNAAEELRDAQADVRRLGFKLDCAQELLAGIPPQRSKPGYGSFEVSKDGKDEWLTPPEIIRALGEFDLDPCAPRVPPWPTARKQFCVTDNGLKKPWAGRVWMNPPYGNEAIKWMSRLSLHGNGIALICARTETKMFFDYVWHCADSVFFFKGRLTFHHVTGERAGNCIGAPSCLVAYGPDNTRAIKQSNLRGILIDLSDAQDLGH